MLSQLGKKPWKHSTNKIRNRTFGGDMKNKKRMNRLVKCLLVLGIVGGTVFQPVPPSPVAAETVQVASYTLTEEEATALQEYLEAKMSIAIHEFYVAYWEEMNANASSGFVNKALEEVQADIGEGLTSEQAALFAEFQSTLDSSINQHFHFMLEIEKVMGGYGIPAAEAIVAKYESEETDEELAPEVELAVMQYMKGGILERIQNLSVAIEDYKKQFDDKAKILFKLWNQEPVDKSALLAATTQYGQALVVASRPEFLYDFTEIDKRIDELANQLKPNNLTDNPVNREVGRKTSSLSSVTTSQKQQQGTWKTEVQDELVSIETAGTSKTLPKTASSTEMPLSLLGFFLWILGMQVRKTKPNESMN